MPTIALVVQNGFGARILLQTDVLDALLESGARVVVLTSDAPAVARYLQGRRLDQIAVEQIDTVAYELQSRGLVTNLLRRIRTLAIKTRTVDDTFEMQWKDARGMGNPKELALLAFSRLIGRLMSANGLVMKAVIALENRIDSPRIHDAFFERYQPDAVVPTSLGTFDYDHYLIREAKGHEVPVVSFMLSWDNTTIRGLGVNLSDHIIVWSDIMRDELVTFHRIPAPLISVAGVPHYDFYYNGKVEIASKAHLSMQFGFEPDKRLLLLGTKSPNTFLYNVDIAALICEAIHEGRLPRDCHLIARLHPITFRTSNGEYVFKDDLFEWDELLRKYGDTCLSVDRPQMIDANVSMFMADSEIPKLASLLKHSEVVVNIFSTLNLEASIFDDPTVNVGFDFRHKRPPGAKTARFDIRYDEAQTHNQRIINSGGTAVAHSAQELIDQINRALADPSAQNAGRRRIVATDCGANPGGAGRAVAQTILDHAGSGAEGG